MWEENTVRMVVVSFGQPLPSYTKWAMFSRLDGSSGGYKPDLLSLLDIIVPQHSLNDNQTPQQTKSQLLSQSWSIAAASPHLKVPQSTEAVVVIGSQFLRWPQQVNNGTTLCPITHNEHCRCKGITFLQVKAGCLSGRYALVEHKLLGSVQGNWMKLNGL